MSVGGPGSRTERARVLQTQESTLAAPYQYRCSRRGRACPRRWHLVLPGVIGGDGKSCRLQPQGAGFRHPRSAKVRTARRGISFDPDASSPRPIIWQWCAFAGSKIRSQCEAAGRLVEAAARRNVPHGTAKTDRQLRKRVPIVPAILGHCDHDRADRSLWRRPPLDPR